MRELLVGEESTSIASLVIEDGDALILGSRSFGKSFSPKTLPELSFLKEEFERGRQVAGMAALIL
ncbi:hypothetical protein GTN42_03860, partial [bacterium]|nr:hypothetical protein [bacterium]